MSTNIKTFKYKIGLAVIRAQPFHNGHGHLIATMLADSETGIVLLGGKDSPLDARNPFTYQERAQMLKNACPSARLRIGGINDIGCPPLWAAHVMFETWEQFKLQPTAYYAGVGQDARLFAAAGLVAVALPRDKIEISATQIRSDCEKYQDFVHPANLELIKSKLTNQI